MTSLPSKSRQDGEEFLAGIKDIYEDFFSKLLYLSDSNNNQQIDLDMVENISKEHRKKLSIAINDLKIKLITKNYINS
jgi:uncharacterized membrane protein YgaE (UPF0421/DUF939 family)